MKNISLKKVSHLLALTLPFCGSLGANAQVTSYPLGVATNTPTTSSVALTQLTLKSGKATLNLQPTSGMAYTDLTQKMLPIAAGSTLNVSWNSSEPLKGYLFVDLNNDGQFDTSKELLAQSTDGTAMPTSKITSDCLPGHYRARMVWNPSVNALGSADGYVIDFLLNVYGESITLDTDTRNGNIYSSDPDGLAYTIKPFTKVNVRPTAFADGYKAESMTIRHGYNLRGEQYDANGNLQWKEYTVPAKEYNIPADSIDGDVIVKAYFEPDGSEEYECIFNDEFETGVGTEPDTSKWCRAPRLPSHIAWGRYISDSPDVVYLKDGKLCTLAMPTPEGTDSVPMITGAVHSSGKFSYLYGYMECRAKTNPFIGNFPAIWMIPDDQSADWPAYGEIDIFETIDTQDRAWHTVHCATGSRGINEACKHDRYHTYGFEWDDQEFRWYVDGKQVFTHTKSKNPDELARGQWPYDHNYYIILNQSVGMGTWAKNPDLTHTYETDFDFVRVYQQKHFAENRIKSLTKLAQELLSHHGMGSPADDSPARKNLEEAIATAQGKTTFEDFITFRTAIETYQKSDIIMPEDGKAFILRNHQKNGTIYVLTNSSNTLSARKATNSKYTDNDIFVCHRQPNGKYYFVNAKNGQYLIWRGSKDGQNGNKGFMTSYDSTYCDFKLTSLGAYDHYGYFTILGKRAGGSNPGAFVLKSNGSFDAWNKPDIGYEDGYSNMFELAEVPYYNGVKLETTGTTSCQSIYLPFATTIPDDVLAYAVAVDTTSQELNLTRIGEYNKILPKNTGALLISPTAADSITLMPAVKAGSTISASNNYLRGSMNTTANVGSASGYTCYALDVNGDKGAGFYPYTNKTYPIPHPILYFKNSYPQSCYLIDFDHIASVHPVTISIKPTAIYDLQGRKTNKASHGIYIVNGKKIIVK